MTGLGFRDCSRSGCSQPAVATLTYAYSDSTAVLGPLSCAAEPHAYDLCVAHTQRLTVPRGWEVIRLPLRERDLTRQDDLLDIADALRSSPPSPEPAGRRASGDVSPGRGRGPRSAPPRHLRAVTDADD